MEIYKYSRALGGLSQYFVLFFSLSALGSLPLFYLLYQFLSPLLPSSFIHSEWSTMTLTILIIFFIIYFLQFLLITWLLSFFLSEKYMISQDNSILCLKRCWPFKHKKTYALSDIKEIRIKSLIGQNIFKVIFIGEVFFIIKYTLSYEKAKQLVKHINMVTGLPFKDDV